MSDEEILDWLEHEVITFRAHPYGWEFLMTGADGEPMSKEVLIESDDFRYACRAAKALQEQEVGGAR